MTSGRSSRRNAKNAEKEETWNRLNELTCFELAGFGFSQTPLGVRKYNREKKASIPRQGISDRDRFWDAGIRAPIGRRIAHASASLSWGAIAEGSQAGDILPLSDCVPFTLDAYGDLSHDSKKSEPTNKLPQTIGRFSRCARNHTALFCLAYGEEHREERLDALEIMAQPVETHPEFPTGEILMRNMGIRRHTDI